MLDYCIEVVQNSKIIFSISIEVGSEKINVSGGLTIFPKGGLLGGLYGLSPTGIPPFWASAKQQESNNVATTEKISLS